MLAPFGASKSYAHLRSHFMAGSLHGVSLNTPIAHFENLRYYLKRLVRRRRPRDIAMSHIEDHPLRYELSNELHKRPFPSMTAPGTLFLSLKQSLDIGRDADAERA